MRIFQLNFFLLCAWVLCPTAHAQEIDLVGNVGWEKVGSRIRIHAERIQNNRGAGPSGLLRLQIWATTNIYDGVSNITGYVLGTLNLRSLPQGSFFENVNRLARYHHPPPGLYYTTVTLEEETPSGFVITDSENFNGRVNLGGFGEGSLNVAGNGQTNITFVGAVSWSAGNGRVQFFAEEIFNERVSGRSGTLRVRLFATSTRYTGGDVLEGYLLATKRVGRLSAQSNISFSRSTFFHPPPPGEYYVTMTLEEYFQGWNIVDYVTFDDTSLF